MVSLHFGKSNETDELVSIFDVRDGLGCNCSCLVCGAPLVAHKGSSVEWHFSHASGYGGTCRGAENLSLCKLCQLVLDNIKSPFVFTLPRLAYSIDGIETELRGKETITISDVSIKYLDKKFNPSVVVATDKGEKIWLEFYTKKSDRLCTKTKIKKYREMNCKVLEIKIPDWVFIGHMSLSNLLTTINNMFTKEQYSYTWLSHPDLNKVVDLVEDTGVLYSNASGLTKVYCPSSDTLVSVKETCKSCPFKISLTKKELKCRGNLSKEKLVKVKPDTVFPPEDINYVGKCTNCGSDETLYKEENGSLFRVCKSCSYAESITCPICDSVLRLKTNKDERFDSYKSQFIGCEDCSFTLTYKTPSGDFADEMKYTGGIDKIRENNKRYTIDLMKYRKARRK